MDAPAAFDAHLHPGGLSTQDLESMRFFGVRRALAFADHAPEPTAKAILGRLDRLVEVELGRLAAAGIDGYAAVGLHPASLPRRGLQEVLAALPEYFRGGRVVALGETGLFRGGEEEEEVFQAQLLLARTLKLPLVVHTPSADKERLTRRALTLIRASGIRPERVLVDHANGRTVRPILALGCYAGLTVHPEELTGERAVALVRRLGSTRLVLGSDAGDRAGDILAVPRAIRLLARARLSARVLARLARENAATFLRLG